MACVAWSNAWGAPHFAKGCDYSVEFPARPSVTTVVGLDGRRTERAELSVGRVVLREECISAHGPSMNPEDLQRLMRRFAEKDGQAALSARTTKSSLGWTVTLRGTKMQADAPIAVEHRCTVGERSIACLTGAGPVEAGATPEAFRFLNSIQRVGSAEDRIGNYRVPAWTKLGLGYYIDLDSSEETADGRRQVLVLREFESREADGALSDVLQYDVDCKLRAYRTIAEMRYAEPTAGGGKPIAVTIEGSPWHDVRPNSVSEEVFRTQCTVDAASPQAQGTLPTPLPRK